MTLAMVATSPTALTEIHQRDIGCVAALAIIADEQKRGAAGSDAYPDVRESGKRWAAIVGERVMAETGQPRGVVAFAMIEAAKAEQDRVENVADPAAVVAARVAECHALMTADLAVIEAQMIAGKAADNAAISGVDWGTDEPAILERYKAELAADLTDRARIFHCYQITNAAYIEIARREGYSSRDAEAMFVVPAGLSWWTGELPLPLPGSPPLKPVIVDEDKEQDFARCVRLGQAAYAKMPKPTTAP